MKHASPRQALLTAVSMEQDAIRLYTRASMVMEGDGAACAERLCRDERSHLRDFTALLRDLGGPGESEADDLLAEAEGERQLFPGGLTEAARGGALTSCRELMLAAMEAEKKSVDFYLSAAEEPELDEGTREVFRVIAAQEEGHLWEWKERFENGKRL